MSSASTLNAKVKPSFLSVYRTPAYNKTLGGNPNSQHLVNKAVSIKFEGIPPKKVAAAVKKV